MRRLMVLLVLLAGCARDEAPQWQLSLSAPRSAYAEGRLILVDPDSWAVAVAHSPQRMGAVFSTQRLVSEWDDLYPRPAPARIGATNVTVSAPEVTPAGIGFPVQGDPPTTVAPASLVLPYRKGLRYAFDMAPSTGWTYTVTFGPGTMRDGTLTGRLTSPATVAFEAQRHRSLPTTEAIGSLAGTAYLVLLDNRDYVVVPLKVSSASLQGTTLTLNTNSARPAAFNRGALFVDGLPTPA